jgi:predicted Zn finger-like uncharacterized protein
MIVTCPACATRYQVDPTTIGPQGRTVRCSKCGHSWTQTPPDDLPREVANLSELVRSVPPLLGIIYDKDNRELQRWTFAAPEARLLPGEHVAFKTELKNPPAGSSRLQIRFETGAGANR